MINLSYELLKANVIEVEVLKDLNMGDDSLELLLEDTNGLIPTPFIVSEHDTIIIPAGTIAKFNVQSANHWYEIGINVGWKEIWYDVALEEDELNDYLKGLRVIGLNKQFVKEEA